MDEGRKKELEGKTDSEGAIKEKGSDSEGLRVENGNTFSSKIISLQR